MRATGWGSGSLETGEPPPATVDCVSCVEFARTLKYSLNSIKRSMAASRSDFPADSRRAVGHAHQATPMLTLFFSFFFLFIEATLPRTFYLFSIYVYIFFWFTTPSSLDLMALCSNANYFSHFDFALFVTALREEWENY